MKQSKKTGNSKINEIKQKSSNNLQEHFYKRMYDDVVEVVREIVKGRKDIKVNYHAKMSDQYDKKHRVDCIKVNDIYINPMFDPNEIAFLDNEIDIFYEIWDNNRYGCIRTLKQAICTETLKDVYSEFDSEKKEFIDIRHISKEDYYEFAVNRHMCKENVYKNDYNYMGIFNKEGRLVFAVQIRVHSSDYMVVEDYAVADDYLFFDSLIMNCLYDFYVHHFRIFRYNPEVDIMFNDSMSIRSWNDLGRYCFFYEGGDDETFSEFGNVIKMSGKMMCAVQMSEDEIDEYNDIIDSGDVESDKIREVFEESSGMFFGLAHTKFED